VNPELLLAILIIVATLVSALLIRPRSELRRSGGLSRAASRHGLQYSSNGSAGPFFYELKGLLSSPLPIFAPKKGVGGLGIRHLLMGRWRGQKVTVFEHWEEKAEAWGGEEDSILRVISEFVSRREHVRSADYSYHACAAVTVDAFLPALSVGPRPAWGRLSGPFRRTGVAIEDDAFNRRFIVTSEDSDFVRRLLDQQMRESLARIPRTWEMQVGGSRVLVLRVGKITEGDVPELLDTVVRITLSIPKDLLKEHPSRPSPAVASDPALDRVEIFREEFLRWTWRRINPDGSTRTTSASAYIGLGAAEAAAKEANPDLPSRQFVSLRP
jgi:hypothetical protein